jgi:poly(3-hydroxyalkanoate) synthetase
MTLIRRGLEQIRREGMANAQQKIKEQSNYQAKVDTLSKHNVGGLYDLREIKKSNQFKEQRNYYDIDQALTEFADMLQSNQLIKHKNKYLEYLKTSGKDDYDSFQTRTLGKVLSEVINDIKIAYEIKD